MSAYSITCTSATCPPAGPSREIALIDDIISDDPGAYVTRIAIPVR